MRATIKDELSLSRSWGNPFWNNADALVQYGLVRSRQPRRVIEIGCGYSGLLLARALARNDIACKVTQIEPHPNETLLDKLPREWELHPTMLQRAPLAIFEDLDDGDVLFSEHWVFERGQTWNEQYVLQAFLMNNRDYRVTLANRYLWYHESATLDRLYGGVQPSYGCSFWMTKDR